MVQNVQSILLNSGVIVIASTEAAFEVFIEQYSAVRDRHYCSVHEKCPLMGLNSDSYSQYVVLQPVNSIYGSFVKRN